MSPRPARWPVHIRPSTHLYDFISEEHYRQAASRKTGADIARRIIQIFEKTRWDIHDTPVSALPSLQGDYGKSIPGENDQFYRDLIARAEKADPKRRINVIDVGGDILPWKQFFQQNPHLKDRVNVYITKMRNLNKTEKDDASKFNCVFVASRAYNLWKHTALQGVPFDLAVASNSLYNETHLGIENIFHLLRRGGRLYFNITPMHKAYGYAGLPDNYDPHSPLCRYQKIPRMTFRNSPTLDEDHKILQDDLHIIERLI